MTTTPPAGISQRTFDGDLPKPIVRHSSISNFDLTNDVAATPPPPVSPAPSPKSGVGRPPISSAPQLHRAATANHPTHYHQTAGLPAGLPIPLFRSSPDVGLGSAVPRYVPPLTPGLVDISPAESQATVGSYATALTSSSSDTILAPPAPRVNSYSASSSPLPPLTSREGYDIQAAAQRDHLTATADHRPPFAATRSLESSNSKMSQQQQQQQQHRNGTNGARYHTGNSDDRAMREPLIARGNEQDSRKKAESMRRKLRTYEAVLALKEGYMPDTQQMAEWARYALRSSVLDSRNRRLSSRGRGFIRDLRAWIEALVELGTSKNYDDKIQEFIYHTSHARVMTKVPDVGGAARAGVAGSGADATVLADRLRKAAALLWSSDEFRGLVNDFVVVGRDIFADAASQIAASAARVAETARGTDVTIPEQGVSSKAVKEKGTAVAESARRTTYQYRDDLDSYLREKFPKQRRDAVVNRMKRVVQDIQENPDFQDTVDFVVDQMHKYAARIKENVASEDQKADVEVDENVDVAMKDVQALLMAFANGKPLDPIHDALRQVMDDVQSDKDLKEFYDQVAQEFNRLVTEKSYVTSEAADARAHDLYERSQQLLNEKTDRYRPDVENLFSEIRTFIDAMRNDRESRRVVEASKKVYNDLVITDKNGNFRGFRKRILWDLLEVVFPRFVDEVKYVPVPRIEYQDQDFDLILENVVLESEHFLPTRTVLEAFTRFELTNSYTVESSHTTTTHLHISEINLFCRDVAFIVRKKTGMIPFSDRGYIDVFMTKKGASADIVLESASHDEDEDDPTTDSYFRVKSVKVKIHNLSYNYHAYHSWAAATLGPFIKPTIRNLLAKVLEDRIKGTIELADRELHAAAERMRVASIANRGGGSLEAWIQAVLSRPPGRRRRTRGEWRISVDDDGGLIFPGEHAPGSILAKKKKAEERVELGKEEGSWRNAIFDVSA